jgi:SRSO17 transposase
MLQDAVEAKVPFRWVTGDSVYGDFRTIRLWLEALPKAYVLAVSGKETVTKNWHLYRVSSFLKQPPTEGWERLSAGDGAKGPRLYDWIRLPLQVPLVEGWSRWLLLRRSITDPSDITAYVCFAPSETTLAMLVQVAGRRWTIEACFEAAKGEVGLDHYEVRSWGGWYRHITLACLAHAFLVVMRAQTGNLSVDLQKGGPTNQASSLTAFKRQRGLPSV